MPSMLSLGRLCSSQKRTHQPLELSRGTPRCCLAEEAPSAGYPLPYLHAAGTGVTCPMLTDLHNCGVFCLFSLPPGLCLIEFG